MPKVTQEDMELESGLVNDFDGTIVDANFGINEQYAAISGTSDPMLLLKLSSPDFENPIEQGWSCGAAKQWEVIRDGKEVVSGVNPNVHRFNMNSRAGKLVTAMFQTIGGGDLKKGQQHFLKKDRYMTEGEFYTGDTYHWLRVKMDTVGGDTKDVLMPVAYIGSSKVAGKTIVAKKETAAMAFDEGLLQTAIKEASGKSVKELKQAIVKKADKSLTGYNAFIKAVLSGSVIEQLKTEGKVVVDPTTEEGQEERFV